MADTGIGMSLDFMEVMYQPFIRQTDSRINTIQGTGLGLAITKKMVDMMGGNIECQSKEGVGTTFTVTFDIEVSSKADNEQKLPLTKKIRQIAGNDISILLVSAYDWTQIEEAAKDAGIDGFISKPLFRSSLFNKISEVLGLEDKAASQEENNSDLAEMKVLVAEDMDVNWEVISTLLDMYGIKCRRAENGKVAVDMLRNIQPAEYDLVFMDIHMPIMNGHIVKPIDINNV